MALCCPNFQWRFWCSRCAPYQSFLILCKSTYYIYDGKRHLSKWTVNQQITNKEHRWQHVALTICHTLVLASYDGPDMPGLTFYRRKDPRGSGTLGGKTLVLPGFSKIEWGSGSRGVLHWYCGLTFPGVRSTAPESPMQKYIIPILSFQVLTSFQTMWFKTDQKCLIFQYPPLGGFTNNVEKGRWLSSPKMFDILSMFIR